jgi:hypothetical protein
MRQLEKSEVVGRQIVDIIVSVPDKPVTMSDQSYSAGFLRLDSGHLINIGDWAPPLLVCDEAEIHNLRRDKDTEKEFRPAIGQKIIGVTLPDEAEDGGIRITTENGFYISFTPGLFWIRPSIEPADKLAGIPTAEEPVSRQRKTWWKFW